MTCCLSWAASDDLPTTVCSQAWSARFHRLLQSNALILKNTIYPEWWNDRIEPWLHYVPVKLDFTDLYGASSPSVALPCSPTKLTRNANPSADIMTFVSAPFHSDDSACHHAHALGVMIAVPRRRRSVRWRGADGKGHRGERPRLGPQVLAKRGHGGFCVVLVDLGVRVHQLTVSLFSSCQTAYVWRLYLGPSYYPLLQVSSSTDQTSSALQNGHVSCRRTRPSETSFSTTTRHSNVLSAVDCHIEFRFSAFFSLPLQLSCLHFVLVVCR